MRFGNLGKLFSKNQHKTTISPLMAILVLMHINKNTLLIEHHPNLTYQHILSICWELNPIIYEHNNFFHSIMRYNGDWTHDLHNCACMLYHLSYISLMKTNFSFSCMSTWQTYSHSQPLEGIGLIIWELSYLLCLTTWLYLYHKLKPMSRTFL